MYVYMSTSISDISLLVELVKAKSVKEVKFIEEIEYII